MMPNQIYEILAFSRAIFLGRQRSGIGDLYFRFGLSAATTGFTYLVLIVLSALMGSSAAFRLCRSIIEAHGQRMSAANNAGQGAAVQFTLPLHQKDTL
jgi:hypothetical protein